ncbi:MAG TPA: hypothetical protein PKY77_21745 [Phycisphaerae bacterium]|nr:hypothetical protein [Phycisphaerae bacterium]HRY68544.1 hypothetical protein [Phycisphaerae bacterium]HSA25592.1 hypothetical protein [Phycisphaerae bacterium]
MPAVKQSHQRSSEYALPPFQADTGFPDLQNAASRRACLIQWVRSTPDDEKRQGRRRSLRCEMTLLSCPEDVSDTQPARIVGDVVEFGDGGLYGVVPIGYGVAIGQRYTFQLAIRERGPEPGSGQMITQQGLIVRTELLINANGEGDRVGIGVRLFGQRCGLVPMPDRI